MTQRMQTVGIALCVTAMATLFASYSGAQTGKIDDDLQHAQEVLAQLSTGRLEQSARTALAEELTRIEAREYTVPVKLKARPYTAGSGYFPVEVSKQGLLEPAIEGRITMPRAQSRGAKSQLSPAYASIRIRVTTSTPRKAAIVLQSVWVRVDGELWFVTSDDPRLPVAYEAGPPNDSPDAPPVAREEAVALRFVMSFDEGRGDKAFDATGSVGTILKGTPSWMDGRHGTGLDFRGTSPVQFGAVSVLREGSHAISMGAWIKSTGAQAWDAVPGEGWHGIAGVRYLKLAITDAHPAVTTWNRGAKDHIAPTQIPAGEWVHVVTTYDTSSVQIFVNGLLVLESAWSTAEGFFDLHRTTFLKMGNDPEPASPHGSGVAVDDFFLTDEVLTRQQIVDVMNGFVEQANPAAIEQRAEITGVELDVASTVSQASAPEEDEQEIASHPTNEAGLQSAIARAQVILNLAQPKGEFESPPEYEGRIAEYNALVPELRAIAAVRFDVPMTVEDVGRYDAEAEVFPVTISREGLLAAAKGTVAMPRGKARNAKPQMDKAWASMQIRVAPATQEALPYPLEVYVHAGMTRWPVALEPVWVEGPLFKTEAMRLLTLSPSTPHIAFVGGSGESGLRVWDAAGGSLILSLDTDGQAICSSFSPDGRVLAVGLLDGRVLLWRMDGPAPLTPLLHTTAVSSVAFLGRDDLIAVGTADGTLSIWRYSDGVLVRVLGTPDDSYVHGLVVAPSGLLACSLHQGGASLRLWNTQSGRKVRDLVGHDGWVHMATFDRTGGLLASAGDDGTSRIWNGHEGTALRVLTPDPGKPVKCVAFSADGSMLASGTGGNARVHVWDMNRAEVIYSAPQGTAWTATIGFGPDDQYLFTTRDGGPSICLWDTRTASVLRQFGTYGSAPFVAWPDYSLIVGTVSHGRLQVWWQAGQTLPNVDVSPIDIGEGGPIALGGRASAQSAAEGVADPGPSGTSVSDETIAHDSAQQDDHVVHIPDANLERVLRDALGDPSEPLTAGRLASLTQLTATNEGISDLTGIEACPNLVMLDLLGNAVTNIGSLSALKHLRTLRMLGDDLSRFSAFDQLTALHVYDTEMREIQHLEVLAQLPHIESLHLQAVAGSLEPIGHLRALKELLIVLAGPVPTDLKPLAELSGLRSLNMAVMNDVDLTPLGSLPRLRDVAIKWWNERAGVDQVRDLASLTSLAHMPLDRLWVEPPDADAADLSVLADVTDITHLWLQDRGLHDTELARGLTALVRLDLRSNSITDVGPLVGNEGLGDGDEINLEGNPLSHEALTVQIPELIRRGVKVTGVDPIATSPAITTAEPGAGKPPLRYRPLRRLAPDVGQCRDVDVSSDGRLVAGSFEDGTVRVWHAKTGELYQTIHGESSTALAVHFVQGSTYVAYTDSNASCYLVDLASGDIVTRYRGSGQVYRLDVSNDNSSLAMAGDGNCSVYVHATGGASRHELRRHTKGVTALSISADGQLLASGANAEDDVVVWDLGVGAVGRILPYPGVHALAFHPRRQVIATGSAGRRLVLWDALSGQQVGSYDVRATSLAFSPDGSSIIAGGADSITRIVDAETGEITQELQGHTNEVRSCAVSGDSRVVATGSWDGTVRIWTSSDTPSTHLPQATPVADQVAPITPDVAAAPKSVPSTALIVGVNAYDHHANLVNPTFDAQAVGKELREVFGTDTTTLLDATKLEFLEGLHALADRDYAEDEQLMVFFSGHGYFDERIRRGYLAFKDSLPLEDDPYYQSFVSHEDVRVLLERLDCNHVLLVVDSCFSGTLDPMVAMAPGARAFDNAYGLIPRAEYIQRKLQYRTRRYITAGGKEYVSDGRPGQHSPFARQFLTALRTFGGSDGILTLEEILLHLERVDPQPRTGELFGNEPGSSFVLVARPVEVPTPSKFGTLTVTVGPPDAQVRIIGGPPAAESLLKTLRVDPVGTADRRYHLPLGAYRVRVSRAGYNTMEHDVTLTAAPHRIEVTLTTLGGP
jgi:WD40 repeat protein/Leucine-rich repeat (LRR) protein